MGLERRGELLRGAPGVVEVAIDASEVVVRAPQRGLELGREHQRVARGVELEHRAIELDRLGRPVIAARLQVAHPLALGLVERDAVVELIHRPIGPQRHGVRHRRAGLDHSCRARCTLAHAYQARWLSCHTEVAARHSVIAAS